MPETPPLISRRVITSAFLIVVGLLVVVVTVGLVRNQVNVNGLVIALTPVLSGVILGSVVRTRKDEEK